LPATMLFRIDALPELLMPPAEEPELLVIVLLSTSRVPADVIPPPVLFGALFPLMVLFEIFNKPLFEMPPPAFAIGKKVEFPLMVLPLIVIVPELLETPPPNAALFPVTLHRVRLSVPPISLRTPPPGKPE
jgi:hypothetical protein